MFGEIFNKKTAALKRERPFFNPLRVGQGLFRGRGENEYPDAVNIRIIDVALSGFNVG